MSESIEKRDPDSIVVARDEGDYTFDSTHRLDMTENALKAVVDPVKIRSRYALAQVVVVTTLVAFFAYIARSDSSIVKLALVCLTILGTGAAPVLTRLVEKLSGK